MSELPSFEDIKSKIQEVREISKNCEVANAAEGLVIRVKQNQITDIQVFTHEKLTAERLMKAINKAFERLAEVSEKEVKNFISMQSEVIRDALKQNLS